MKDTIAVIYLARSETAVCEDFAIFLDSYRQYSAGYPHELFIVHKGAAAGPDGRRYINGVLEGLPYQSIYISDTGYDIQAYLAVAKQLPYRYLCFFNTYSKILSDNWLAKLIAPILQSVNIGMTGATASYESIHTSYSLYSKVIWMCNHKKISFSQAIANEFKEQLSLHCPEWLEGNRDVPVSVQEDKLSRFLTSKESSVEFEAHWRNAVRQGAGLHQLNQFKPFPNPHLRSNAFIINRAILNSLKVNLQDTKLDCVKFESGLIGLPTKLEQLGFQTRLVGANGVAYDVEEWPTSNIFRLENQENLLVQDNQTNNYLRAPQTLRNHLQSLTWGDYADSKNSIFEKLGYPTKKGNLNLSVFRRDFQIKTRSPLLISIVIPTRNRGTLLKDALHTVVSQKYENWECIVFDNCSDVPLKVIVDELNDQRIKYFRSEIFLPVTDSWNCAIDHSTGDYVTLLGDDDGLTPEFMLRTEYMVRHFSTPDFIYTALFQYFHPGVAAWQPEGYIIDLRYGVFFDGQEDIFNLDPQAATHAVKGSLLLERNFAFNMQSFCFSRQFLHSLRRNGKIFHSPFPDYYLANVAMACGKNIMVSPKPIAIAGVSKASFGYTLFNNLEDAGAALLATDLEQDKFYRVYQDCLLPGPSYNTKYIITMLHVKDCLGNFIDCDVAIKKYRKIQLMSIIDDLAVVNDLPVYKGSYLSLSPDEIAFIRNVIEAARSTGASDALVAMSLQQIKGETTMYGEAASTRTLDTGGYDSLREVFDALQDLNGVLFSAMR
jgi:glycosyltransferase involved in cell wall biosynthesis